jgi:hypothetical protein
VDGNCSRPLVNTYILCYGTTRLAPYPPKRRWRREKGGISMHACEKGDLGDRKYGLKLFNTCLKYYGNKKHLPICPNDAGGRSRGQLPMHACERGDFMDAN